MKTRCFTDSVNDDDEDVSYLIRFKDLLVSNYFQKHGYFENTIFITCFSKALWQKTLEVKLILTYLCIN